MQAEPCHEASTGNRNSDFGTGGSVVEDLMDELPKYGEYKLFFDNLLILPLVEHLSKLGIGGTEIIRHNRTQKAPLIEAQAIKKKYLVLD